MKIDDPDDLTLLALSLGQFRASLNMAYGNMQVFTKMKPEELEEHNISMDSLNDDLATTVELLERSDNLMEKIDSEISKQTEDIKPPDWDKDDKATSE